MTNLNETLLRSEMLEYVSLLSDAASRGQFKFDADDQALAVKLLEAAVTLQPGEILDLTPFTEAPGLVVQVLLRLTPFYKTQFAHPELGALPDSVVRRLLKKKDAEVLYQGVLLTKRSVFVYFVRQAAGRVTAD